MGGAPEWRKVTVTATSCDNYRMQNPICLHCEGLKAKHERLERVYAAARGLLASAAETTNPAEYHALKRKAEDARLDWTLAYLEFENHRREHQRAEGGR